MRRARKSRILASELWAVALRARLVEVLYLSATLQWGTQAVREAQTVAAVFRIILARTLDVSAISRERVATVPYLRITGVAGGTSTSTEVAVITRSGSPSSSSSPATQTTTETVVNTNTITPSAAGLVTVFTTVPSSTSQGNITCSSAFKSCPASLGGGCCPTDRACGTVGICPPLTTVTTTVQSTTVAGLGAPVRPTSGTTSTTTLSTVTSAQSTTTATEGGYCPTGFYMCSAYYIGGCCQVGRNCDTTSCPPGTAQTIVSNGETIVVTRAGTNALTTSSANDVSAQGAPATTTTSTPSTTSLTAQGHCPSGWFDCGSNAGGGCCPGGYACGASCTATQANEPSQVAKVAPANGAARIFGRSPLSSIMIVTALGGLGYYWI